MSLAMVLSHRNIHLAFIGLDNKQTQDIPYCLQGNFWGKAITLI